MEQQFNSLYIVLVEPSSSQSKIVLNQFSDLGIQHYKLFKTASEALDAIESDPPDLVISALHLPDNTGIELVHEMRNNKITEDVPFMLISTTTLFKELDAIKQAGASAVLPKPFKAKDLKRAVLTTMDWLNPESIELDNVDIETISVLLVDDSKMARRMIRITLEKMGIEKITEAVDGKQAIPIIQSEIFDLIVTDYNMPEVDGHELLKFIRNESNQSSVPVLMVTTEGDQGKLAAIQQDGISAIVDKPFAVAEVKRLIETSLSEL